MVGTSTVIGVLVQVFIFYLITQKEEFEEGAFRFTICPNCNSANHIGSNSCKKCGSVISSGSDVNI